MTVSNSDERAGSTIISNPEPNHTTYIGVSDHSFSNPYHKSNSNFLYTNKEEHYQHLKQTDKGKRNGWWTNDELLNREANLGLIKTIAAQLDLSEPQREVAMGHFMEFDLRKFGMSRDIVAFALCAYVVESDDRNRVRRTHPACDESDRDRLFVSMADDLGLKDSTFASMYGKIASRLRGEPKRHYIPPWQKTGL